MLYVLTNRDDIFSLRVSTLTLTKMVISGLRPTGLIWSLVCHKEFVYIVRWDINVGTAVYKCVVEQNGSLRAVGSSDTCTCLHICYMQILDTGKNFPIYNGPFTMV